MQPGEKSGQGNPRVTVVIPTYNYAVYLGAAVESVLNQTFRDVEILVLDNASTDNTPEVVARYSDVRLRYLRNPKNLGFVGNVALGLQLARGELLTYLHADDLWEPEFLTQGVALLDGNPELSFVHSNAVWIDEKGAPFGHNGGRWARITPGSDAFLDALRYGFTFASMLMRSDAVRSAGGFDAAWGELADLSLFLRLCLEGDVGYLSQPLVRYRIHTQSLSTALYGRGQYIRKYLRLVGDAFEWPRIQGRDLRDRKCLALRCVGQASMKMLHLVRRASSRGQVLSVFWEIVSAAPGVACYPSTWVRLAFALLPDPAISRLQGWKRRWWRTTRGPIQALDEVEQGHLG